MAEEVEFGQNVSNKTVRNQKGLTLFPPKNGHSLTIRFVGTQQKIYQKWDDAHRKFSFSDTQKEKYSPRLISFVIDRSDSKVKAFLCPSSIWNKVGSYAPDHDFFITRSGQGIQTRYSVESKGETCVDDELLERVLITSETYSLSEIFIKKIKWELLDKEYEPIRDRFDILDL